MTARKSLSLASASTQKTYRYFSGRSRRLMKGDMHVSAGARVAPSSPARASSIAAIAARHIKVMAISWLHGAIVKEPPRQISPSGRAPQRRGVAENPMHAAACHVTILYLSGHDNLSGDTS